MSFKQLLLILRARRRIAVGILAAVVVIAMAVCLLLPKQYTASAWVVVDVKSDPVASAAYPVVLDPAYMGTQVDIAASERVAQRAVKILKLDEVPEFQQRWQQTTGGSGNLTVWLAGTLLKKLSVKPSPESNVIEMSVKWPDAKAAATLANAFAQAYIDTNIALKVEPAVQYATWFDERSSALRADVEAKQKLLSDFENQTGIVATDERLDVENARLAELSTQLVTIQAQRQDSQSRQRQVEGDKDSIPEVLQSPLIASLKADLSQLEAKQKEIVTRLGTNHPEFKSTEAKVNSLRERLAQESARIVASLTDTTNVNERRESDISAALAAQKRRVLELKHQRDQASVLQNDVLTAQRNLDAVTQRLAQSNLEGQTQQANIVLLTPATQPMVPSSPKILATLLLSVLVGGSLAIASALFLELSNPRIRTDEELVQLLGVPLLSNIGSISYPPLGHHVSAPTLAHMGTSASSPRID
jgi:chain length determinant protein EpsF